MSKEMTDREIELQVRFDYDIAGTGENPVSYTSTKKITNRSSAGQKLRVLADITTAGWESEWSRFYEEMSTSHPEFDWNEKRELTIFIIVDGLELARTVSECIPQVFPQMFHELILRLAEGIDAMMFELTKEERKIVESGGRVKIGDMIVTSLDEEAVESD